MHSVGTLRLALRLLARDRRAGELRLFAAAVVIAVGAVTAVGFFNDRLDRGLTQRSAGLLGADFILSAPAPVTNEWIDTAERRGLHAAAALDFASVVVRGDRLQLAAVRALDQHYPLRGSVRTAGAPYEPGTPTRGPPAPGSAWAEARLLQSLGIEVGQEIEIGVASFRVTRVLTDEPGRIGIFFSLGPRVLINLADVPATGVVQPGSRVTYRYGFAGGEARVRAYREWLTPRLGPRERIVDARQGNATTARTVERLNSYFGLTSLLAVMLAGVAIAMGARRYAARHYDTSAMLRALGATQNQILALYLPQFIVLGLIAAAAGCAVGFAAQQAIYLIVKDVLPAALPPPGAASALLGVATGMITLAGFALVPIVRLRAVPPLRVLRRELVPLPARTWSVIAAAGAALLAMLWYYTGSFKLTAVVFAGATVGTVALLALVLGVLRLARRMPSGPDGFWRQGFARLQRRVNAAAGQILAFGLTLMAMAVIAVARTDLLAAWETQVPVNAPNHFIFNIQPGDVSGVEDFFRAHAIRSQALYPLVRGRLVEIDGAPVREAVTKEEGEEANSAALRRDLNLTWAADLPPDNIITAGVWWSIGAPPGGVSVEEKLAQRLHIVPGDRLTFVIASQRLHARVASLRRVQWESFHPNFFMIFSPGTLEDFPATYMTSFRIEPTRKPVLAALVRAFPSATILELDQLLGQIRAIVRQASTAVELVLLFVFAGGLAVLFAALSASLDERFYEGALLRAFGASRRQLRRAHLAEFATLGAVAGIFAAIGAEAITYLLYTRVFDIAYTPKWWVWAAAPTLGALVIGIAGLVGTRRVIQRSPLAVLQEMQ
jgi:putative ABC transport system permease protein